MKIRLTAKTRKGKNILTNNGSLWVVQRISDSVAFSSDRGLWGIIYPVTDTKKLRWINLTDDVDFNIEDRL